MLLVSRAAQQGSSLIEILIALLVLSIGLVGLARFQNTVLQGNHSAYLRSQTTILLYDIADRMRANRSAALSGAYNISSLTGATCDYTPPTGSQASKDKAEWLNSLVCQLTPDAQGQITQNSSDTFTVRIQWNDNRGRIDTSAEDDRQTFENTFQL